MEKRVIVGRDIRTSVSGGERSIVDKIKSALSPFGGDDVVHLDYNPESTMKAGNVYAWDASYDISIPTPLIVEKIQLNGLARDLSPRQFQCKKRDEKEECLAYYVNDGSMPVAFWFIKSKSLVIYFNGGDELARAIVSHLGNLDVFEKEKVKCIKIKECHNGEIVEVDIPEKTIETTVGCDPEFEVIDGDTPAPCPSNYGGTDCNIEIGRDGAGCQLELRPKAGNVDDVIKNIKALVPKLKHPISVVGDVYALGGHIHVGVGNMAEPTNELLWLLDYFMGEETLKLSGRAREGYRKMGAYEMKKWGFEYRTPPSAIFANPEFARLAMMIVKNVTECYVNGRTMKVSIPKPIAEDYMNYCGFTMDDCISWMNEVVKYKELIKSNSNNPYTINFAHYWDESIPVEIKVKPKKNKEKQSDSTNQLNFTIPRPSHLGPDSMESMDRSSYRDSVISRAHDMGITVNDDWRTEAIETILNVFSRHIDRFPRGIGLFGLRLDRGNVTSGFSVDGYENIDIGMGSHSYGFPRVERDSVNNSFLTAAAMEILRLEGICA